MNNKRDNPFMITYDAGQAGTINLRYPVLTVRHQMIQSKRADFTAVVRLTYSVRSLLVADEEGTLQQKIDNARQVLGTRGGTFSVFYGDVANPLLTASQAEDVAYGPIPQVLEITKLQNNRYASIIWQLVTERQTHASADSSPWAWIDFAYTTSTSLDESFNQHRTYHGALRIDRSHATLAGHTADAFRDSVEHPEFGIAPLPTAGAWQRIRRDYRLNEDGSTLIFTIEDVQQYTFLPLHITTGDFSVTTVIDNFGQGRMILRGSLGGKPNTSRVAIQAVALDIIRQMHVKVITALAQHFSDTPEEGGWSFTQERVQFTVHYRANKVDFEVIYRVQGSVLIELEQAIGNSRVSANGIASAQFAVNQALDWLTQYDIDNTPASPDERDQGAYGSVPIVGPRGDEAIGPILDLNYVMREYPESRLDWDKITPIMEPGTEIIADPGRSQGTSYMRWSQALEYRVEYGRVTIPVKGQDSVTGIPYRDIHQTTHWPQVFVTNVGEASALDAAPRIAGVPFVNLASTNSPDYASILYAVPIQRIITPVAPTADGERRVMWREIWKLVNPELLLESGVLSDFEFIDGNLRVPDSPFLPDSNSPVAGGTPYSLLPWLEQ